MIFGCWTSASRKSVKPVVEQTHHLLVYPMAYEGLEQSPNIIYTGAAPNQQVIPALSWCYEHLKARKFYLDRLRLRVAALRQRNRQRSAQGSGCRVRRRVLHPLRQFRRGCCRRGDPQGKS